MAGEMPYLPGATTIGVVCKDAVILASERRVSYGYFVMSRSGRKIFKITESIGAACAGLVSDMQVLVREVAAYMNLYAFDRGRPPNVKTAAKLMGNLLFERRLFPYITQTIVGGIDDEGPSLYVLDVVGSVIQDKYASVGTGAEMAMGLLEAEYRDGMEVEEAKDMVTKAAKVAVARDVASGDVMDLLIITGKGVEEQSVKF